MSSASVISQNSFASASASGSITTPKTGPAHDRAVKLADFHPAPGVNVTSKESTGVLGRVFGRSTFDIEITPGPGYLANPEDAFANLSNWMAMAKKHVELGDGS